MKITNTAEMHEAMVEFGKWARAMKIEGAIKPPLAPPAVWHGYRMSDEDAMRIDASLSLVLKRHAFYGFALKYRYIHRKSYRKIGKMLGCPKETAEKAVFRGLDLLLKMS